MNQSHLSNVKVQYNFFAFILALFYSAALVYIIPMEGILDRSNYLVYASSSDVIFARYFVNGLLSVLTNEPVWLFLNVTLSKYLTSEQVVYTFILVSSFISSYLILKVSPKYFFILLLFLFVPQVISKYVVHLRQGLAISIFLIGWNINNKWRLLFYILAPLIHSSFFIVLLLLVYTEVLLKLKLANDLRSIAVLILGLAVGLGLGFITSILGARQANEYAFASVSVSGLAFVFWFCILTLFWLQGRHFLKQHSFAISGLIFYLSTYFFIEVTGRVFESIIIIVLISSVGLTQWRRSIFIFLLLCFVILSWTLRIEQPWLGWGSVN
ncbi:hypothetical protein WP3W19E03_13560 [Aeromonas veronii]|uniref:EpsG family protein n=1 Tax=Aeromonas veronii TaxID=654 RepID=A0A6S5CFT8_AERVE|nr:EpsG family protein [Aeromonas veronii]BBR38831.1 hypothetical protein WP3W19E03_13560 [Aeromonas veronii]